MYEATRIILATWLWTCLCISRGSPVAALYRLTVEPSAYTIYKDVLKVKVHVGQNVTSFQGSLRLVSLSDGRVVEEIEKMPFSSGEIELQFKCGSIDHAGQYQIQLLTYPGKKTLNLSDKITAKWPNIQLSIPLRQAARTHEVVSKVHVPGALCDNKKATSVFYMELIYYQENTNGSITSKVLDRVDIVEVTKLRERRFQCFLFDRVGKYQVFLKSKADTNPVSVSNHLTAFESQTYDLIPFSESILPCKGGGVKIEYRHPPCISSQDKIRVFSRLKLANSSTSSPTYLEYVSEKKIKKDATSQFVVFPCNWFHVSVPVYCFRYVATARDGTVSEPKQKCLPTQKDAAPVVDGGLGEWNSWGGCSVSCGFGVRTRQRLCNNPPPSLVGKDCEGDRVEIQPCSPTHTCKPPTPVQPKNPVTMSPDCACGCVMYATSGHVTPASWCTGVTKWIIQGPKGSTIQLTFTDFNLDPVTQWVKVRDGEKTSAELLVNAYGDTPPDPVKSSGNVLSIAYRRLPDSSKSKRDVPAFVARYKTVEATSPGGTGDEKSKNDTVWRSTITIVGSVFCGLILLAFLIYVIRERCRKRRGPTKGTPVHESLLINGEIPNSPSHSSNVIGSGPGSNNVSFTDPAGSPARQDQLVTKGVSTHPGGKFADPLRAEVYLKSDAHGGRQVSFGPDGGPQQPDDSRRSSCSSSATVGSCNSPVRQPSAGGAAALAAAEPVDIDDIKTSPLPIKNPTHTRQQSHQRKHKHHRRRHSPESPTKRLSERYKRRSRSSPTRGRGSSPDKVISSPSHTPTKSHPSRHSDVGKTARSPTKNRHKHNLNMDTIEENTTMDSNRQPKHRKRRSREIEDVPMQDISFSPGERPPVEGKDTRRWSRGEQIKMSPDAKTTSNRTGKREVTNQVPSSPDLQNANYIPPKGPRPQVQPLPLRHIERPDGQSPESLPVDPNANTTPSSITSSIFTLSPGKKPHASIPPSGTATPTEDGFEYDDYVGEIPGSILTMDRDAYTLTWSQRPTWAAKVPTEQKDLGEVTVEQHPLPKDSKA